MSYICYLLLDNSERFSYIGITNNLSKRIKQHNSLLVGGAKYTSGKEWYILCYISGFFSKIDALQFEWFWKKISKKSNGSSCIEKKINALKFIDLNGKSTSKSLDFKEYPSKLSINIINPLISIFIDMYQIVFTNFTINNLI